MRVSLLGKVLAGSISAAFIAGCGGAAGTAPMPSSNSPRGSTMSQADEATHLMFDATANVGVRLTNEKSFLTRHYGKVLGYFKGKTSPTSQVVVLLSNTNVVFDNVDSSLAHTGSFLGDATKTHAPWPAHFNGSSTQSKAGTPIGTTGFSTGTLLPGKSSLVYTTGAPGFYMFGCAFHYDLDSMRTVIVVKT
jgi:plastocyanin